MTYPELKAELEARGYTQTSVTQVSMPSCFLPSPNPRNQSCLRCGKLKCRGERAARADAGTLGITGPSVPSLVALSEPTSADSVAQPDSTRPRDLGLERELTLLAAKAAGHETDYGLRAFSDQRAWPGGVRDLDFDQEIADEISDGSNYALWAIERIYDRVLAGDPAVLDDYERWMRVHSALIGAWRELRTKAA